MIFTVVAMVMMFTPTIATIVVVVFMRQPETERLRFLGMWPLKPVKRVIWWTVFATTVPLVLVTIITGVAAALGLLELDLRNFSGFEQTIEAQLPRGGDGLADALPPLGLLVALQIFMVPVAALVNSIPAFGEELGWRGWLLPAFMPLGTWPALLATGAIWGLWHSPLILLGYNFGLTDWRGVALMTGGCIVWGILLGWSRLRTGSVWPAVVGHGGLNAAAGFTLMVSANIEAVQMSVVGALGLVAWGVLGIIIVIMVVAGAFTPQPELARPLSKIDVSTLPWRRQTMTLAAVYARAEHMKTPETKLLVPVTHTYVGYATVVPHDRTRAQLKREWGITQAAHADDQMQHGVTSISYGVAALAIKRGESYESFYARLSRVMPNPESMVFVANAYSVQQGQSGAADEHVLPDHLAYDIGRYANLLRISVATGLIGQEHADGYADILGLAAVLTFSGWKEYGEAFVHGAAEHPGASDARLADAAYWLLHSRESPWLTEGWFIASPSS